MGSTRWFLVAALVAAAATVAALVAALATAEGNVRTLLVVAVVGLLASAAFAGAWALTLRRRSADPLVERAETASKLAHELKNPLMAIKGLASTGSQMFDQLGEDERREFFTLIDAEAGRLGRVIEQSSTAMKVDAEQIIYLLNEEDLGSLVEHLVWATPHGEHPMTVETDPGISVRADRRHLGEAIGNVIENASKFSPPDAPIDVSVRRGEDGTAVIEIADRGPGIPRERAEQVFERFGGVAAGRLRGDARRGAGAVPGPGARPRASGPGGRRRSRRGGYHPADHASG